MVTTSAKSPVGWVFQHCRDLFKEPTDPEKIEYLSSKKELSQNHQVNVDQEMSLGPALYLWTHRLTNIDVVSVVTTTPSIKYNNLPTIPSSYAGWSAGGMEGLPAASPTEFTSAYHEEPPSSGFFDREKWTITTKDGVDGGALTAVRGGRADAKQRKLTEETRLRLPLQQPVFTSPLEATSTRIRKGQERLGECLVAECERFMRILERERRDRGHLEAFACTLIQATFRGYFLRKRWNEVICRIYVRLRVRKNLRKSLKARGVSFSMSKLEKKQKEDTRRYLAAKRVQASFRCFLARQTLEKRIHAAFLLRRRRAASILQCWMGLTFARRSLRYEQTRALAEHESRSALKIQTQYRQRLGARVAGYRRRALHSTAATMIQEYWRLHKAIFTRRHEVTSLPCGNDDTADLPELRCPTKSGQGSDVCQTPRDVPVLALKDRWRHSSVDRTR